MLRLSWMRTQRLFARHETILPFLNCSMIPDGHHAHLFSKNDDVLFLQSMVQMMSAVGALVGPDHSKKGRETEDEGIMFSDTDVQVLFLEHHRTELHSARLTIMHGMGDPLVRSKRMKTIAGKSDD